MLRAGLLIIVFLTGSLAVGQDFKNVNISASQQFAHDRLFEMADFLGGLQGFRVNLLIAYEVLQDNGQMIEFGEKRQLSLLRPNKLKVLEIGSHGEKGLLLFDGHE